MPKQRQIESISHLVYVASRLFTRSVDRRLRQYGVTSAQLSPLLLLFEHGTLVQRDLVTRSAVAQPAMVAMLAKLERQSLIAKQADEQDGRQSKYDLTRTGRRVIQSVKDVLLEEQERSLRGLNATERTALARSMQLLIKNLEST